MTIYPAVLTDVMETLQEQISMAQELPDVETVHIDIIDGIFADNLTITPGDLAGIDFGELSCDLHLMTEEPMDGVFELVDAGEAVPVRAVIGQVERMSSQQFFVEEIAKHNWQAGLSLDIFTPLDAIDEASWQYLSVVQLMAVEAGFQGQQFHKQVLEKIAELRAFCTNNGYRVELIVDGALSRETAPAVWRAGADSIAVGSALWGASEKPALLKSLIPV